MKSLLILCLALVVICFTIATCVGCVCATIDIIRAPKRYKVNASADEVPEDYLNDKKDQAKKDLDKNVPEEDAAPKVVIS